MMLQCGIRFSDDTCVPTGHDDISVIGRLCLLPVPLILLFVCIYAFDLASCYVAQAGFGPTVPLGWPASFCLSLCTMLSSSVVCVAVSPAVPGFRLCCVLAGLLVPTQQSLQRP